MHTVLKIAGVTGFTIASLALSAQPAFAVSNASNYKQTFTAKLSGENEVPMVATDASGVATFGVSQDERLIDYTVSAKNAKNIIAAHIHCAEKSSNGPVIANLFHDSGPVSPDGEFAKGTLDSKNILPAAAACSPNITSTQQLVQSMREGKLYVNVHTTEQPAGLIRGQIEQSTIMPAPMPTNPVADAKKSDIIATANPDGVVNDALVGTDKNLTSIMKIADSMEGIASIQSAQAGKDKVYATFDATTAGTGGILTMNNVADRKTWTTVMGASTGIIAPKAVEVVDAKNALIISDNGAKDIKVFANTATGNTAPLFSVSNLGGPTTRNVWDSSYDSATDTLYVAATDGVVLTYDDFFATKGVDGPTKLLIPANNAMVKQSVNLHGIVYSPERDSLVLSDVGSATNATDGQLFTINNVRYSSGRTAVTAQIVGANTMLGNPVDLTTDGQQVYVAEKSNDRILRFDDIYGRSGVQNVSANQQVKATKPESIDLQ